MDDEKILNVCCFFGHRKVTDADEVKNRACAEIERLIVDKGVSIFLFGSKSEFDDLCYDVVTELKEKHPYIKRIYVRAEYQYINDNYKKYLLERYEDTYYPECIENSGKASYVERNREMISNAYYCVVYYDEEYMPPRRRKSKSSLNEYQPQSGTRLAYDFAIKKNKQIINLYCKCDSQ